MSENLQKRLKGCPVEAFLKIVGQRWNSYILLVLLQNGPIRFGKLKGLISAITQKVLTEKLRELEKVGLVHRDFLPTIPPNVSYSLTPMGHSLSPFLEMISEIAHDWREKGHI